VIGVSKVQNPSISIISEAVSDLEKILVTRSQGVTVNCFHQLQHQFMKNTNSEQIAIKRIPQQPRCQCHEAKGPSNNQQQKGPKMCSSNQQGGQRSALKKMSKSPKCIENTCEEKYLRLQFWALRSNKEALTMILGKFGKERRHVVLVPGTIVE
jgi:hypothetical protein